MKAGARALLALAVFIVALAASPAARAHSSEFILARVVARDGGVEVELTLDCSGNPMVGSESEARAVLDRVLRVRAGGATRELHALAPLRFERRTQIDAAAPIPHDPVEDAKPHLLVCAVWSWKCATSEESIAFEVPPHAGQSLILWTPAESPDQQPRWVILLGGDVSPAIAIPRHPSGSPWLAVWASAGLMGVSVPVLCRLRRKDRAPRCPAIAEESDT